MNRISIQQIVQRSIKTVLSVNKTIATLARAGCKSENCSFDIDVAITDRLTGIYDPLERPDAALFPAE